MIKFVLSTALISLFLYSCGNTKDIQDDANETVLNAEIVEDWSPYERSSETVIRSVSLAENLLTIMVSYNGGCEEHEFMLLGNSMILKSMPPIRGIKLFHNNNGDTCRELVEKTLVFNIQNLAYEGGTIHLSLDGWEEKIIYDGPK